MQLIYIYINLFKINGSFDIYYIMIIYETPSLLNLKCHYYFNYYLPCLLSAMKNNNISEFFHTWKIFLKIRIAKSSIFFNVRRCYNSYTQLIYIYIYIYDFSDKLLLFSKVCDFSLSCVFSKELCISDSFQ